MEEILEIIVKKVSKFMKVLTHISKKFVIPKQDKYKGKPFFSVILVELLKGNGKEKNN